MDPLTSASLECSGGSTSFDLLVTAISIQCESIKTIDEARAEVDAMLASGALVVESTFDGTLYLGLPQTR
tara:strand:+ start:31 stop:240 length:210 start_codon:yes stop_codon:yes gene_type:complete